MSNQQGSGDNAPALPPSVFILDNAKRISINSSDTFSGVVIHADNRAVYQKVGDVTVRHTGLIFKTLPNPGDVLTISYAHGRAAITQELSQTLTNTRRKKLSRH